MLLPTEIIFNNEKPSTEKQINIQKEKKRTFHIIQ